MTLPYCLSLPAPSRPAARGEAGIARRKRYGVVRDKLAKVLDQLKVVMAASTTPAVHDFKLPDIDAIKSPANLPASLGPLVFSEGEDAGGGGGGGGGPTIVVQRSETQPQRVT